MLFHRQLRFDSSHQPSPCCQHQKTIRCLGSWQKKVPENPRFIAMKIDDWVKMVAFSCQKLLKWFHSSQSVSHNLSISISSYYLQLSFLVCHNFPASSPISMRHLATSFTMFHQCSTFIFSSISLPFRVDLSQHLPSIFLAFT